MGGTNERWDNSSRNAIIPSKRELRQPTTRNELSANVGWFADGAQANDRPIFGIESLRLVLNVKNAARLIPCERRPAGRIWSNN